MIIHRGTLTLEKLEQLAANHLGYKKGDSSFHPAINPNVISLVRQEDGNYKGYCQKNGKFLEVREQDPNTALVALLTHP